jgi:hypothetical protein
MNFLKNNILWIRWGDALDSADYALGKEMTFLEVLKSSFMTPKSVLTRNNKKMLRR